MPDTVDFAIRNWKDIETMLFPDVRYLKAQRYTEMKNQKEKKT